MDRLQAYQRAISFHEQGRLWEAGQLYKIVVEADRSHFDALLRLGIVRIQQGKFGEAGRLLRRAVKVNRKSADAHHSLGCALTGLGRGEDAVRHYEASLALRPEFPEAHNNLGHQLVVLDRYEEAIAQFEKALALRPQYAEARNNLGNTLHLLGHSKEAIEHCRKALAVRPDYAEAHFNIGTTLTSLGRNEEAISHYQKAIGIRSDYVEAYNSLGNAFRPIQRYDEAIAHYEKAISIRPAYIDARVNLGVALWELGRQGEAVAHLEKALSVNPNYVETLKSREDALIVLYALTQLPEIALTIDPSVQVEKLVQRGGRNQADFENLVGFVRATVLDRANHHADAWQQLVSTNRAHFVARRGELLETSARAAANRERLRNNTDSLITSRMEDERAISLFILGPSQSGKTTMERLVSTLDGVKCGYEHDIVEYAARRVCETTGHDMTIRLEDLPQALYPLCRKIYMEELARRVGSTRIFTSTHPIRIHHADLLASMLPNVRFLCIKREVEDNILRIYMKKYSAGNIYAYDLKAARDHVVWYHQMIDLLAERLPEIVRVVQYEDMIADAAAVLTVAADLCSVPTPKKPLPFLGDDAGCAGPYRQLMAAELRCPDGG